jgi:hypothetical protein
MSVAPNTFNTLSETLHKRWKVLRDLRDKADYKISDLEDGNDDGITAGELKS